jgi:hypothetical protein
MLKMLIAPAAAASIAGMITASAGQGGAGLS